MASEFISAEMSFDELKMNDLYDILLDKYDSNRKSIKGKNLSKEEKQIIYRKSFMETKQKLSENQGIILESYLSSVLSIKNHYNRK